MDLHSSIECRIGTQSIGYILNIDNKVIHFCSAMVCYVICRKSIWTVWITSPLVQWIAAKWLRLRQTQASWALPVSLPPSGEICTFGFKGSTFNLLPFYSYLVFRYVCYIKRFKLVLLLLCKNQITFFSPSRIWCVIASVIPIRDASLDGGPFVITF